MRIIILFLTVVLLGSCKANQYYFQQLKQEVDNLIPPDQSISFFPPVTECDVTHSPRCDECAQVYFDPIILERSLRYEGFILHDSLRWSNGEPIFSTLFIYEKNGEVYLRSYYSSFCYSSVLVKNFSYTMKTKKRIDIIDSPHKMKRGEMRRFFLIYEEIFKKLKNPDNQRMLMCP
ncbi:hypothetical protein KC901_03550 [Patescibacteria group bacterium]|nr:hypothetical protein [Patescibacteria group bacterium]